MDNDSDHWASEREGELILDIIQGRSTISEVSRSNHIPASAVKKWMKDAVRNIEIALANQAAQEVYERIETLSRQVADAFEGEPTLEEIKKHVDSRIAKGDLIVTITPSLANSEACEEYPSRGCVEYLVIAYAFFLEGQPFLNTQNANFALNSFEHAARACNGVEERLQSVLDGTYATDEDYEKELAERARDKARRAGQARSEKQYRRTKTELVRLLKEKKPDGGWKGKAEAFRALGADMVEFIASLKDDRQPSLQTDCLDSLKKTLTDWMREDSEVRKAYESTRHRSGKS